MGGCWGNWLGSMFSASMEINCLLLRMDGNNCVWSSYTMCFMTSKRLWPRGSECWNRNFLEAIKNCLKNKRCWCRSLGRYFRRDWKGIKKLRNILRLWNKLSIRKFKGFRRKWKLRILVIIECFLRGSFKVLRRGWNSLSLKVWGSLPRSLKSSMSITRRSAHTKMNYKMGMRCWWKSFHNVLSFSLKMPRIRRINK